MKHQATAPDLRRQFRLFEQENAGMANTLTSTVSAKRKAKNVSPSVLPEKFLAPFSLDQELEPFGQWSSDPIWVPPKDAEKELAKSMLNECGLFSSKEECWESLIQEHKERFTQVREFELHKPSIRLPQGKLLVSVTEQKDFNKITDKIPSCVQTRLDEFLAGPGKRSGVKVYYLKPLCVEVEDKLVFTTPNELESLIESIRRRVFSEYRRQYLTHRPLKLAMEACESGLAFPRRCWKHFAERRKRAIDAYHAKLEFNRRKAVLRATKCRKKFRTDECNFEDLLILTKTPERDDVIEQYVAEHKLSEAERRRLLAATAVTLPWFISIGIGMYYFGSIVIVTTPPVLVFDPVFVAEMPDEKGVLLKIGHFDEIGGVMHVEI